jgi:flagella basal body P-ring formation protein FlgA
MKAARLLLEPSFNSILVHLFPVQITANLTKEQKRAIQRERKQAGWSAARDMLQHEARVVWVAGRQIKAGEQLNAEDSERLDQAMDRITEAGRVLNGRP